jgi:hypothetical protein
MRKSDSRDLNIENRLPNDWDKKRHNRGTAAFKSIISCRSTNVTAPQWLVWYKMWHDCGTAALEFVLSYRPTNLTSCHWVSGTICALSCSLKRSFNDAARMYAVSHMSIGQEVYRISSHMARQPS